METLKKFTAKDTLVPVSIMISGLSTEKLLKTEGAGMSHTFKLVSHDLVTLSDQNITIGLKCIQTGKTFRAFARRFKVLATEKPEYETISPIRHPELLVSKSIRKTNLGNSNYSTHKIQPWDIWLEYTLNPFDADVVKRILREKYDGSMSKIEHRILDYKKIIHVCQERIRQLEE